MWLDKENEFSDAQSLASATTGDNISTNVIDLGNTHDFGPGENIVVRCLVTTAIAGTSSTVDFQLVNDNDEAATSHTVVASSGAIAEATLVAGYYVDLVVPKSGITLQYLAVNYEVGTANLSAGVVDAFVVLDEQNNKTYPA